MAGTGCCGFPLVRYMKRGMGHCGAPPAKINDDDERMIHECSMPAALIAGLVSFLSPCVLPLVPPYLIYLTGATIEHVANDEAGSSSRRAGRSEERRVGGGG